MSLSKPMYVEMANLTEPIEHSWSDSERDAFEGGDPDLEDRLTPLSCNAAFSLALGALEWVVWRFERYIPDETPFFILEGVWAGLSDWRKMETWSVPEGEWENLEWSVGEPLIAGFAAIREAAVLMEDGLFPVSHLVSVIKLPIFVLPNADAYRAWRRAAIRRLRQEHPQSLELKDEVPVPRVALDLNEPYAASMAAGANRVFLDQLEPETNRFLVGSAFSS